MHKKYYFGLVIILSFITLTNFIACNDRLESKIQMKTKSLHEIRRPAVSGAFYPADPEELKQLIQKYLSEAESKVSGKIRGLVAPHAGYIFSGKTAAYPYKLLSEKQYDTVIILGPNHQDRTLRGASIPAVRYYKTPLGLVELSPLAQKLLENPLFTSHTSAHQKEHSIEVQLPFLQTVLDDFKFVPIVLSGVNAEKIAEALAPHLDDKTLVIASTDLSHYRPYDVAVQKDNQTADAIVKIDIARMYLSEACGQEPVLVLMHLARKFGWQAKLLDYRNSGDTAGDKSRVVGYCAVAFCKSAAGEKQEDIPTYSKLNPQQQEYLLSLARKTLKGYYRKNPPQPDENTLDPRLAVPQASFVTLTKQGRLRGCIGNFLPELPLYRSVMNNTLSAALNDSRFPIVREQELKELKIEISALSLPHKLEFGSPDDLLQKLRPNIDGVILVQGRARATFLPQVWAQLPDKIEFLEHLSQKAGLPPTAWRSPDTVIITYTVHAFEEGHE